MSAHVPVTAEEFAEIARLDAEATPGPWTVETENEKRGWHTVHAGRAWILSVATVQITKRGESYEETGLQAERSDLDFIARARALLPRLAHDLAERTAERDAANDRAGEVQLRFEALEDELDRANHRADEAEEAAKEAEATVERLIREAGAVRLDERQRAEAEHRALADEGRQRDANRIERLEGEIARLRVIVDDADRAKAEHAATRDELRRLHDVLSGKRGAP